MKKCFDKMWAEETANDIYKAGLNDDQFILVSNSNKVCQVAVKTPWGALTKRREFNNIEMQGSVLAPLKCSVQMDTLGKEMLENTESEKILYKYKDCVDIPVLTFVDDALSVTECGINTVKMNAHMQSKVNTKKLELGHSKCFKIHIGKNKCSCPDLMVNDQKMMSSEKESYLGDIITSSAKIDENIKMRHDKGIGIANKILSTLQEVSFGVYHFEMGLLFRSSELLNGILFNTDAHFAMSDKHIEQLEECDKYLLRGLFNAGGGTPIESLFIETSTIPLRFILKGRRIMFYWTLLKKTEEELVKRVFNALQEFSSKGDWLSQVKDDLIEFDISLSAQQIKSMSRFRFKNLVQKKIKEKAAIYLTELQMEHSKTVNLKQCSELPQYLTCEKLNTREKQLLFRLRNRTTPNKINMKNMHKNDLSCIFCKDKNSEENLDHLLICSFLSDKVKDIEKIKSEDIFGSLKEQVTAVKIWDKIFKLYEKQKDAND